MNLRRVECFFLTFYYTIRYGQDLLKQHTYLMGHDFKYLRKPHEDHWHIKCKRCGYVGATDIGPKAMKKLLKPT